MVLIDRHLTATAVVSAIFLSTQSLSLCKAFTIKSHSTTSTATTKILCNTIVQQTSRLWMSSSTDDLLERTKLQLERLKKSSPSFSSYNDSNSTKDSIDTENNYSFTSEERELLYQNFISYSANALKDQLRSYKLKTKGRKPDLARRLVDYVVDGRKRVLEEAQEDEEDEEEIPLRKSSIPEGKELNQEQLKGKELKLEQSKGKESSAAPVSSDPEKITPLRKFASISLSSAAGMALANANYKTPTSIQSIALPLLVTQKQSMILHAETGSGKTLCYLLPITETMWREHRIRGGNDKTRQSGGEKAAILAAALNKGETKLEYALIMTPTRELAAQVAGVATAIAPPGSVRLVTMPTNLIRDSAESKEKSESGVYGGRFDHVGTDGIKLIIGSAKTISLSLFGDENDEIPVAPTSKPEAKLFIKSVRYLVLDEVDRLLNVKTSRETRKSKFYKKHDKPAAVITASITRATFGKAQIVAASATVGRPLRREFSRVLGLLPNECPPVIRGTDKSNDSSTTTRAITVPKSLTHYVLPCEGMTSGSLLTAGAFLVKGLQSRRGGTRKVLFVVTNTCGINIHNTLGALRHFNVTPKPKALLDLLEGAEGTDNVIGVHREVSGVTGLGESLSTPTLPGTDGPEGYNLVCGEDSVRGLHLNELDSVVIIGRPKSPDNYIHIAGRAGRLGGSGGNERKKGEVVNIVSYEQASALSGWASMLGITFVALDEEDANTI